MASMPAGSVDSIVTDPPYGLTANKKGGSGIASVNLESPYGRARIGTGNGAGAGGFMGLAWDAGVPPVEVWLEALRLLKPGGHLLAFSGSRTYHRMACAIDEAGFEIRDQIMWLYGSGFPKSHNLDGDWHGWGTALKPAHEPICVARKPLIGTVAANVLSHGTGALNIDGCRVGTEGTQRTQRGTTKAWAGGEFSGEHATGSDNGRWPANVIHDGSDEVMAAFPDAPGKMANASAHPSPRKNQNVYGAMCAGRTDEPSANSDNLGQVGFKMRPGARRLDSGTAARFFYCAKASRSDRNEGCGDLPRRSGGMVSDTSGQHITRRDDGAPGPRANFHPTVKPTDLMRYLCRLVTPPGGIVLDPFMGSGSTGKACVREGFQFIGIDLDADYLAIARARIAHEAGEIAASLPPGALQGSLDLAVAP